jgi:molybdopterin-guanine dinucleotide biosynthesis protein A
VLAGGRSARFGDADKLAAPYQGVPLLHHAVLRLAEVTGDVVVVLAADVPVPAMPLGAPVRFARDARPDEGPLAGAAAGLALVDRDLALLAGGDMPELSTPVVLEMLRVAAEAPVDAVALQDGEAFRPLPVVVGVRVGGATAHDLLHRGERSLRGWLHAMRVAVVDETTWTALDPQRRTLRDIDTPGDLGPP